MVHEAGQSRFPRLVSVKSFAVECSPCSEDVARDDRALIVNISDASEFSWLGQEMTE